MLAKSTKNLADLSLFVYISYISYILMFIALLVFKFCSRVTFLTSNDNGARSYPRPEEAWCLILRMF